MMWVKGWGKNRFLRTTWKRTLAESIYLTYFLCYASFEPNDYRQNGSDPFDYPFLYAVG